MQLRFRSTANVVLSLLAILLISTGAARADVAKPRTTIEVPLFEGGEGSAFFLSVARQYEKLRPDIRVDLTADPRIVDQLRMRILEGTFFETTDAAMDFWPLIHNGDVMPMDAYLAGPNWEGDSTWRDSFIPSSLDPYSENGKTYGIPLSLFVNVIWYNPKMFADHGWKPPQTWDEFFALCEKIKAAGISPLGFQGRYPYYAEPIFTSVLYSMDGMGPYRDFRNLRAGAFNTPSIVAALDVTQRFGSYFQPGAMGMSHTEAQTQFLVGNVAMLPCGSWLKSEMMGKIPDGFKFAAFNLPRIQGGIGDPNAMNAYSSYYFVMSHSPHPREAIDFLRFLTSRKVAAQFARDRDITTAVVGADRGNLSSDLTDVSNIVEKAKVNFGDGGNDMFVTSPAMGDLFDDVIGAVLRGKMSPADAAIKLESDAATIRSQTEHPDRVVMNHLGKATLLLAALGAAFVFVVVRGVMGLLRSRNPKHVEPAPGGRLRWRDLAIFTLPALCIYLGFVVIPSLRAFDWSLYTWDGISSRSTMVWVGLLNFRRLLFESDGFWIALGNNFFLMFMVPLFVIPISLFLAASLSRGVWGSNLFRIVFFFPNLLGTVAATFLWLHLYNPQGGLINAVLTPFGLPKGFAWLSEDHLYWALIPMSVWAACGFNMVLYMAAMQAIPQELYEAADIEGASQWRQFWSVTVPLIWEMLAISFVFMILGGMKAFDVIWLLTNQRPSTHNNVIGTRLVQVMFSDFNVGESTAMAVLLFLLVFFGSTLSMRAMRRDSFE